MAERTSKAQHSGDETPAQDRPQQEDEPLTFQVDDLIARGPDYLGQPSHVVAGALHGRKADLSLEDANARVADFLEKTAYPAKEA